MKKITIKLLVVGLLFAGALFVHPSQAAAASNFNDNAAGQDLPTVMVAKYNGTCTSNCAYGPSVSVNPGDIVSVAIYYHNTGPDAATSTSVRVSPQSTGSGTSHTLSGTVGASNAAHTGNGSATVNISSAQTLTYMPGQTFWYPDKHTYTSPFPSGQNGDQVINSGGVNLGTIQPPSSCSGYPSVTFCHQGYVIAHYKVGTTTANCVINSFNANPSTVAQGNASTLSWSTSGCVSASISPSVGSVPLSGTASTGSLYNTTTFVLTAVDSLGSYITQTVTVNVTQSTQCSISYFNASPTSITAGQPVVLSWATSGFTNVSISGIGPVSPSGTYTVFPNGTTTYTLTASGGNNCIPASQTMSVTVTVTVNQPVCVINFFNANPSTVTSGGASTLSWSTSNCTYAYISPNVGTVAPAGGSISTGPNYTTTTYTINAQGQNGNASQTVVVFVNQPVCTINSFTASPTSVTAGQPATLSWNTTGFSNVSISNIGTVSPAGSGSISTVPLYNTTTYTITASGNGCAQSTQTVTVTVNQVSPNCVINSFTASPTSVGQGGYSTLSWFTSNCTIASITPMIGSVSPNGGSVSTGPLQMNTTYTLTATGANGGSVSQQITVYVNAPAQNCIITYFTATPSTVNQGGSTTLSWNTTNCNSVSISTIGNVTPASAGSISTAPLSATTTYTITAIGTNTVSQSLTVTVNNVPPPPQPACTISNFTATPSSVVSGSPSILSWTASNCTYAAISPSIGIVSPVSGSASTGPLYATTTFSINATGPVGNSAQSVTVTVTPPTTACAINSFTVSPQSVTAGQSTTLSWATSGFTNVSISNIGTVSPAGSGSISTAPIYSNTTYTLTASGGNCTQGNQTQSLTIVVNQQNNASCTINSATAVSSSGATLNAFIDPQGTPVTYYFQYGTNPNALNQSTSSNTAYSAGQVFANVGNLSPNTTYYFRLFTNNNLNCSGGGVLSFNTSTGVIPTTFSVVTTVATNVGQTVARLNGVASNSSGTASVWFEYGTDQSVPFTTAPQTIGTASFQPISAQLTNLAPGTTYFFRLAGSTNTTGTIHGNMSTFTTSSPSVAGASTVFVSSGSGTAERLMLKIETPFENVKVGDTVPFTVTWKNISNSTLHNAVLKVTLPSNLVFAQASTGIYDLNTNALTALVGTLTPGQSGSMNVITTAKQSITGSNFVVTTATMAFTLPSGAQDEAIAYAFNTIGNSNFLAGLALFGTGFFPDTVLGWLILLLIIAALIALARRMYYRRPVGPPPPPSRYPAY